MSRPNPLGDVVADSMRRWGVPGVAVGTISPERRETWTFGVTALDTRHPVRADTAFQIGSVTKPFTATLLAILAERGRMALDSPVIDYVPDLSLADPEAARLIKVRHLLTHQAGFWGDWFEDFGLADDAIERFVAQYYRLPQMFEPGAMWAYNNCGYILAGLVASRVTGVTFERSLSDLLLKPLGLEHTFLSAAKAIAYPVAVGHTVDSENRQPEIARHFLRPRARNPAGGILASIEDVLSFAELHLLAHGPVLSRVAVDRMHQRIVDTFEYQTSWGLGFKVESYGAVEIVGHGGATNGFRALLQMAPSERFAVAILTNSDGGNQLATEIANWILKEQLNIQPTEPPTIELDESEAKRLSGTYVQPYGRIEIKASGGQLEFRQISDSPYSETSGEQVGEWQGLRSVGDRRMVVAGGDLKGSQLKLWDAADGSIRFLQAGGRLYLPDSWDYEVGVKD